TRAATPMPWRPISGRMWKPGFSGRRSGRRAMAREPVSGQVDGVEPDRYGLTPHPRERFDLVGHGEAERAFLDAWRAGRLHHAWLIGGPRGIGKATFAYRVARFLLANPDPAAAPAARDLAVAPEHPVARKVAALSHPDL